MIVINLAFFKTKFRGKLEVAKLELLSFRTGATGIFCSCGAFVLSKPQTFENACKKRVSALKN